MRDVAARLSTRELFALMETAASDDAGDDTDDEGDETDETLRASDP